MKTSLPIFLLFIGLLISRVTYSEVEVEDSRVKQWVVTSLSADASALEGDLDAKINRIYSLEAIQDGWRRLKRCRDAGNSLDLNLASAEHYMFMRMCAGSSGETGYRRLPKWYETIKEIAIRSDLDKLIQASDQPVSPTNEKVTQWGLLGVERGLEDYKVREGKEPSSGISSLVTLVGSSYYIYYYDKVSGSYAKTPGMCDISLPPHGVWESSDSGKRWLLEFSGNRCKWTERSASGAELRREVVVRGGSSPGIFKISRDNDPEVLTFLGFSPAIQSAILARSPEPSFFVLHFGGSSLSADWNGLLVIKDAQARFKEMKQPGQSPAKQYAFIKRNF